MSRFLIMAGEASGDLHGAKLATELRSLQPHVELLGLGGPRMRDAGVQLLDGIDRLDIIGLPSVSELRQAIRTVTALPIRHVVISHYHADHFYGLQAFADSGAQIWASAAVRGYLASVAWCVR